MFNSVEDLAKLLVVFALIVLPALGITVAITARLALRPIVEAIMRLRELGSPTPASQVDSRMAGVEEEVRQLREAFERLAATVEFDAQIRAAGEPPRLPEG